MIAPIIFTTENIPTTNITINGTMYVINLFWNFYGGRYYFSLETNNEIQLYRPLIGSPDDANINLALGLGTLVFRSSKSQFESDL